MSQDQYHDREKEEKGDERRGDTAERKIRGDTKSSDEGTGEWDNRSLEGERFESEIKLNNDSYFIHKK